MRILICAIGVCTWLAGALPAADLILRGVSNQTYQNQTCGHLSITNSNNITIKNCTFSTSSGAVADISGSNHITIDSCEFDGDTTTCTGMNVGGSYITISRCKIHDLADDAFQIGGGDHLYLRYNTIYRLFGCGTDGGCGPCYNGHSDGFELSHLDSVELVGNLVYDVRSNGAVMMDNYSGGVTLHNVLFANNIFYTPATGVIVYVNYVDGLRMYNNTFWKSNWVGVAVGRSTTRVEAYNNIVQNIDYDFQGGTYNTADHKYDYNLVGSANHGLPAQAHDVVNPDPKFRKIPIATDNTSAHVYRNVVPADFELLSTSPAINKGTTGFGVPSTDFYNKPRVAPYDMGAIEFENNGNAIRTRDGYLPSRLPRIDIFPDPCMSNAPLIIAASPDIVPVEIAIYSLDGRKVRTLPAVQAQSMTTWDKKDDLGQTVKSGLYQVRITSRNSAATESVLVMR